MEFTFHTCVKHDFSHIDQSMHKGNNDTQSVIIDIIGIKFICNFKTIFIFCNLDGENLVLGHALRAARESLKCQVGDSCL